MRRLRLVRRTLPHGQHRSNGRVAGKRRMHQVLCVKGCPTGAKYFDDPGYLYHKSELEEVYARPAKNEAFL